jgi:hypothetical protein
MLIGQLARSPTVDKWQNDLAVDMTTALAVSLIEAIPLDEWLAGILQVTADTDA